MDDPETIRGVADNLTEIIRLAEEFWIELTAGVGALIALVVGFWRKLRSKI